MTVDIAALAKLARLEISEDELVKLETEIPAILQFVETIQGANAPKEAKSPEHRNIMRADEDAYAAGRFTEALLGAAPLREGDRIAVKQVVSRQKAVGGKQ
jgi:aspartyl/glutamyl-tRNA(Asn/Gln) amidotransferase C subunit